MAVEIERDSQEAVQRIKRREAWLIFAGAFVAVAAVALAAVYVLLHLRDDARAKVQSSSQNLATSLTQTFDGLFDSIDIALLASADEISQQLDRQRPDPLSISGYLELQSKRLPHVAYLRATDATGDVVYGPGVPTPRVNLADREFFRPLQTGAHPGLYVAKPLVGKISKRALVTLARAVRRADGRFAGVVYASINVDEISNMLQAIAMEEGGAISVRDRDAGLIARFAFGMENTIPLGSQELSDPFRLALRRDRNKGDFVSDTTSIDPTLRQYSFVRSAKYGYLVTVGFPIEPTLQKWRNQATGVAVLLALFSLALFALLGQALRSRARLEQNYAQLSRAETEQHGLLEKLNLGIVVHAPDTQIIFSNARAAALLGLSEDQMRGKTAIDPAWCFVNTAGQRVAPQDYPVGKVLSTHQPTGNMVLGVRTSQRDELTWVQGSAFPEFAPDGTLKQIVVNFHDITQMRETDERWRFALEGSGDGVWDLNLITGALAMSGRYQEILGLSLAQLPTSRAEWKALAHPDDAAREQSGLEQYLQNPKGVYTAEFRMRTGDGSYKWLYARGMVVSSNADGKPLRMVGTDTDISELKAAEAQIWNEANFDSLTQLPNRRLFYDRLEMQIKQAQRDGGMLALLFIDLDHFKEINDTLGHHMGDRLLIEAAQRLKEAVRAGDTVARLGGDEFTVTLAEQQAGSDIGAVAQKIIDLLSSPYGLGGQEAFVSASIGIAMYPNDALTVNDLVKNADQAMYAAKNAGRRGFQFFTNTMQASAIARMALAADLRRALAAGQFEVHYQPIVELATGTVRKAEALLRWHHPERGLVPPAEFIHLAEEIGAIHEIGDWVFQQAAQQVARWQSMGHSNFQVSVNKSPVQFSGDHSAHNHWIAALQALGLAGNAIVIEITEGVLMDSNANVAASLMQFRDAGIQVAIDDFGTGYSSLAYLRKFDIDYLKIDRSFVGNLVLDSPDFALCEAIIVMAHKLGLQVIAEGVETTQQRDLLAQIGCDFAQGYLFSRPVSAQALEAYLDAHMEAHPQGGTAGAHDTFST